MELAERDLREVCTAAVERCQGAAERKEQRIALRLPDGSAVARIDAGALGQVLDNLLLNAVKFSPWGTGVSCEMAASAGCWRIEVRDEGPGVPAGERARLFHKFNRGSARPTAGESSSGLGLFIVKTLAEAMHGRVDYLAGERGGAVFRVTLPQVG
jgi:signal transduction histidine kinase